jgi:TatD DNase family protein
MLNTSPGDFEEKVATSGGACFSCGIHPCSAEEAAGQIDLLRKTGKNKQVFAIGEAGLDKLKGPDMDIQTKVFGQQIELAIEIGKPLIIHCVKAWDELIALYKEYKPDIPWIIHGYRGNVEQTKQLARLGFKFSVGEFFNGEAIRYIPLDSIFCETDMADISICKVYSRISSVLNLEFNQFVRIVADNVHLALK